METVDTFQNRLKKALNIRNIKPVELHEKTGISESLISKYLSGVAIARQRKISLLSDALNVNEIWLLGYDVPMERSLSNKKRLDTISLEELFKDQVPLLGTVKAGYDYLANENVIDYISINFKKEDYDYYALKITGDSMETIMSDGDYVVIQKQSDFNSGDYCVILINGEEATVKRVYKLNDGIELVALNPAYPSKKYSFEDMKKIPVQVIGIVKQLIKNLN